MTLKDLAETPDKTLLEQILNASAAHDVGALDAHINSVLERAATAHAEPQSDRNCNATRAAGAATAVHPGVTCAVRA